MQRQRCSLLKHTVRLVALSGMSWEPRVAGSAASPGMARLWGRELLFVKGKRIPEKNAPLLGGVATGSPRGPCRGTRIAEADRPDAPTQVPLGGPGAGGRGRGGPWDTPAQTSPSTAAGSGSWETRDSGKATLGCLVKCLAINPHSSSEMRQRWGLPLPHSSFSAD